MKKQKDIISQIVIDSIKNHKRFSLDAVVSATGLERRKVLRVLNKFCREGYLSLEGEVFIRPKRGEMGRRRKNPTFVYIKDLGARKPERPEPKRDKIWRTLRYLKRATRTDLVRLTGCDTATVCNYTFILARHNYIRAIGMSGKEKVWLLVQDIGPKKPKIQGE